MRVALLALVLAGCAKSPGTAHDAGDVERGPDIDASSAVDLAAAIDLAVTDGSAPAMPPRSIAGTWQLAEVLAGQGLTGWPCVYNETTCNTPSGLANGTYAVAEQMVNVLAGDVLVVQGRVEAVNNLYDGALNDDLVSAWIACDGVQSSAAMTKDLIEYIYEWFPGPTFGHNGNHHGPVTANGFCVASSDGTIDVKLMTLLSGPDHATTFVSDNTNLVIEHYAAPSAAGMNAILVGTAPSSTATTPITATTESGADDDLTMTIPSLEANDLVYLTGQTTAKFPSGDRTKITMFGGELRAAVGSGSLKKIVSAVSENVLTDLTELSFVHQGVFKVSTAGTLTAKTGLYYGDDEAADRDDAYASLQGIVFRATSTMGTALHGVALVPAAGDFPLSTSAYDIAQQTITLADDGIVDATAFAQIASTIPTQVGAPQAACTAYAQIFAAGTTTAPLASTVGHPVSFAQLYTQHPLVSEGIFSLAAGTYDVHAIVSCVGSGVPDLSGVAAGSGLLVAQF